MQNWKGLKAISQHGLVPQSLSFEKYTPGSPELLATIFSHNSLKSSFVTFERITTAELFALPLCGFISHQEPCLQVNISLSCKSNKEINAARRIPPDKTASAI